MARRRDAGPALLTGERDAEAKEIKQWYHDKLATTPPPSWPFDPVRIGPTWQWDENGWILPEYSGGWDVLAWGGLWLKDSDGRPWAYTMEQARFILHYMSVDPETLRFDSVNGAFQRCKGHGKDPLACGLSTTFMVGPSLVDEIRGGEVVMRPNPAAWVQVFAVSKEQTKNTMKLFPQMITPEAKLRYGIQVGRSNVWALGDSVGIEANASSADSAEGNRPSLVIRNETQNWRENNGGHELAGAIDGNVAKARKDSPARILDIFNAYREGQNSIAQQTREGWEESQGDLSAADENDRPQILQFGLLYDSLEAPANESLKVENIPRVLNVVRGDSVWLDTAEDGTIIRSILDPRNSASESRRKWFNQVQSDEESFTTKALWDGGRRKEQAVHGEQIALFLDASKSDDSTALVGCRICDGLRFVLGLWQKPAGARGKEWVVPRGEVDIRVREAHRDYRVVGFFVDPSHALEDETGRSFWDGLIDVWHRDFGRKYKVRPSKAHAVRFDMSEKINLRAFVTQVALCEQELIDGELLHDGDPRMRRHVLAACRIATSEGMSIGKTTRGSKAKVDIAIGVVGSGLVRRMFLNQRKQGGGKIW